MFVVVVVVCAVVRGGNVYAEWFALPHAICAGGVGDVVDAKVRMGRSVKESDVCGGGGGADIRSGISWSDEGEKSTSSFGWV